MSIGFIFVHLLYMRNNSRRKRPVVPRRRCDCALLLIKKTEQAIKSLLRSVFILQKRCQSKRVAKTNAPHFREERDVCAG